MNVFVRKKAGSLRCTSDFRALNSCTVSDAYPMEGVKESLDSVSSKKLFTNFDLKDGYFQVALEDDSKPLTAVRTVLGLFQYCRLPMGLKNSRAVFQRSVNTVLGNLKGRNVWASMDDGTIGSEDEEQHIRDVDEVLSLLKEANVKLKFTKCSFGHRTAEILGHKVTADGVLPSDGHVEAIQALQEPRNGTELLRFIGLVNYFADFVPDYTERARPLQELLKGSGFNRKKKYRRQLFHIPGWEWKWGDAQRNAWKDLKTELVNPCMLTAPDSGKQKRVLTDASDYGIGGVLLQLEPNGQWKPVCFTARKLKGAEANYTVSEKEFLAVVHALRKWRYYLQGTQFTVMTDHQALKWLMSLKEPKGRLARWMMDIQDYDFVVQYASGRTMEVADALSRDSVGRTIYPFCAEKVNVVDEAKRSLPTVEEFKEAQKEEFGSVEEYCTDQNDFVVDEDGLLCKMDGSSTRIVVPMELVPQLLSYLHGSLACGHYGIAKTAHRIRKRFWWTGWKKDVPQKILFFLNCAVENLGRPNRLGKMKTWHPVRRFQVVAIDITEISPPSKRGYEKVLVMGCLFTRFIWAVPVRNKRADAVAVAILNEWILRFGPPERLLSDRAKSFMGELVRCLCERVGTRKIFTSPYHPQTDGFVERFNRTLARDIRAFVGSNLEDWDEHGAMACFRYNTSRQDAIGMTPYKAMFGIDPFYFDADVV